jgi:hypothetical protein
VHGNLIEIARAIGVPFSRLRCALPEELCAGVTAHCSGNTYGLSAKSIEEHADKRLALLRRLIGDGEPGGADEPAGGKVPALLLNAPSIRRQQLERMPSTLNARSAQSLQCVTATALLFAVLSTRCLVPEGEARTPCPHAAASYCPTLSCAALTHARWAALRVRSWLCATKRRRRSCLRAAKTRTSASSPTWPTSSACSSATTSAATASGWTVHGYVRARASEGYTVCVGRCS